MVLFHILLLLTLNLNSIEVACDLALNSLFIPFESDYPTVTLLLRTEIETTTNPQLPKHNFPEEQLASSTEMMDTNFTIVDFKKRLEETKRVGPLWKYRYAISSEEPDQTEPPFIYNQTSEIDENNKVGEISNEPEDHGIKSKENTTRVENLKLKEEVEHDTIDLNDSVVDSNKMSSTERRRYADEIEAGDLTQLFGVHHTYQPKDYRHKDLGGDSPDFDSTEKSYSVEGGHDHDPLNPDDQSYTSDYGSAPVSKDRYSRGDFIIKRSPNKNPKKDSFWDHPMAKWPASWDNKDREPEQPRYPIYDPSYPKWEVGYPRRPGNKRNIYMFIPPENYLNIDRERREIRLEDRQQLAGHYDDRNDPNKMSSGEVQRYKEEIKVGDLTQLQGTNLHINQPSQYRLTDLGRRFVVQKINVKEHNILGPNIQIPVNSLIPKRAPPEIVLAVAKESARLQASEPVDPDQYTSPIKNKALRSGEFWNSYWKDDIADPLALRSGEPDKNIESLRVKLSPGTPIYEYVSQLNKKNPKLLYVINKRV